MGIKAVDIDASQDYIIKCDKDSKEPTIWKIGNIDSLTLSEIEVTDVTYDEKNSHTQFKANILGREIELVRNGLKGWSNFNDQEGKPINFTTVSVSRGGKTKLVVSDMALRRIPTFVIKELAEAIRGLNKLTEEEVKN